MRYYGLVGLSCKYTFLQFNMSHLIVWGSEKYMWQNDMFLLWVVVMSEISLTLKVVLRLFYLFYFAF